MSDDAITLQPLARPPDAVVRVPGSKSISNRVALLAALADGRSVLDGVLFSDDTRYMAAALRALGIAVEADEAAARLTIEGRGGTWPRAAAELFVGNAGTAMRFLVAALCLGHGRYRIDGTPRMRERPIQDLVDALGRLGARLRSEAGTGSPPVLVEADGLPGGATELAAARSSQFVSALLQVAPYAARDVVITLTGPVIAQPYIDMTVAVMGQWGVTVERAGDRVYRVASGQRYRAQRYAVEPDASSAHYFWAAAALTGGRVRVVGLHRGSLQGDVAFAALLERMGARVRWEADAISVEGPAQLAGIDADLNACSDTAPTLAAIAPFASGPVHIRNVAHLRWQESDRLRAVASELARLGARVEERDDGLSVWPSPLHAARIATYDDHRIAMAFALVGLKVPGVTIADPGCVAKTFPDFFARLEGLRR
ncbi:3-phosphoshikimate 1-carboxyvinyltransferase [bacterium]|nr:3-phosphoshikimate 1-carboxyvinyltransferase [bacterium]